MSESSSLSGELVDASSLPTNARGIVLLKEVHHHHHHSAPAPQATSAQGGKVFSEGDVFSTCIFSGCRKSVLWAANPSTALNPYRYCSNNCPGGEPKAIHESCIYPFVISPENALANGEEGITISCSACNGSFDINLTRETWTLVRNFFGSRTFRRFLLILLAFFAYGFVWKTWAFIYVSLEWEPVDLINNPRYIRFDKEKNKTVIDRPAWNSFYDWRTYNHCVITEWGKRRLLTTFERETRGRSGVMLPIRHDLNMMEIYGQLYSLLTDRTYDSFVDLTHYFSPCSDTGTLPMSWSGLWSHIAICFHAARTIILVLLCGGSLALIDALAGSPVRRRILRSSLKIAVYQGGVETVVRATEKRAGVRRRLIR